MKKLRTLLLLLFVAADAAAQNPSACFMEGSTFRTRFNPAFAPLRGYINVPVLGGIELSANNTLPLDRMLYPRDGRLVPLLDRSVTAAQALDGIRTDNIVGLGLRTNLIGFGMFASNHKDFWAFDIDFRTDAELDIPGSLLRFVKRGEAGTIRNLGFATESSLDIGFGYSFPLLGDRLHVGAKAKVLIGLVRAKVCFDRIDVALQEDRWTVDAVGTIEAHIPGAEVDYHLDREHRSYFRADDLGIGNFKPAGYGFAIDLGATYDILPDLQASLAVTDLGFIGWNKGSSIAGRSSVGVEYTGVTVEGGEVFSSPDFSFDDISRFRPEAETSDMRMLHASLNAGIEYFMWNHRVGFGLLYQARFLEFKSLHSITGSVNFSPARWFTLTAAYTRYGGRGGAFGLALNACPGWINFFVGTDLVTAKFSPQFIPVRQRSMHVTFGLGFPLGRRSHRVREYIYSSDRK